MQPTSSFLDTTTKCGAITARVVRSRYPTTSAPRLIDTMSKVGVWNRGLQSIQSEYILLYLSFVRLTWYYIGWLALGIAPTHVRAHSFFLAGRGKPTKSTSFLADRTK